QVGHVATRALRLIPKNNWPGSSRKSRPRDRLSREELATIIEAAEGDVRDALSMLEEGAALIGDGNIRQPEYEERTVGTNYTSPFSDNAVCLAALDLRLLGSQKILRASDLKADNVVLFNAVSKYGLGNLTKYLYPQAEHLVP